MEKSKCPKCGHAGLEVNVEAPKHSNFNIAVVRCESCKTAIGVMDYWNIGDKLHKLAAELNVKI